MHQGPISSYSEVSTFIGQSSNILLYLWCLSGISGHCNGYEVKTPRNTHNTFCVYV